jgi:hypothetical protein
VLEFLTRAVREGNTRDTNMEGRIKIILQMI